MRFLNENYKHGFVRVACAVLDGEVGKVAANVWHHLEAMDEAEQNGVDILVFPELSITKYSCGNLFQKKTLQENTLAGIKRIVKDSRRRFSGIMFVGAPLIAGGQPFNCAIAIQGGKILGVAPKMDLPGYSEFTDDRWFRRGEDATVDTITLCGQTVPFSAYLLYEALNIPGLMLFTEICEGLWGPDPISSYASLAGATVTVNLSASPAQVAKADYRRELVRQQASRCKGAYAYTSAAFESTTDVVYDGHCLVAEINSLLAESQHLGTDDTPPAGNKITIVDVDLDKFQYDRAHDGSWADQVSHNQDRIALFKRIPFKLKRRKSFELRRFVDAYPFIPKDPLSLDKRCREIFTIQAEALAGKLKDVARKTRKRFDNAERGYAREMAATKAANLNWPDVYFGFSGGSDSTHVADVLHYTFKKYGQSLKKVHALAMPGFGTTKESNDLARFLSDGLGFSFEVIDIRGMCFAQFLAEGHKPFGIDLTNHTVESFQEALTKLPEGANEIHFENVQASMRTKILMDKGFTIGTGDLTELWLGWCTNHGDKNSHYGVNAGVPKTLVKFMIRWAARNLFAGDVRTWLETVANRMISPELLPVGADGQSHQNSESKLGDYDAQDFFMYHLGRWGCSKEKILYLSRHAKFEKNFTEAQLTAWCDIHFSRYISQQFKSNNLPEGVKVGTISKSPRADHLMPGDASMESLTDMTATIGKMAVKSLV